MTILIIIIIIIAVVAICIFYEGTAIETDPGVIINGVEWATCNLAWSGSFTGKPEDEGGFFKSFDIHDDDCPSGWRLPREKELAALLDKDKVHFEKANLNGTTGMRFVDKDTGCSMFLPAAGRSASGLSEEGGYYWCYDTVDLHNDSPVFTIRYAQKFIEFDVKSNTDSISVSHYTKKGAHALQSIRVVREK